MWGGGGWGAEEGHAHLGWAIGDRVCGVRVCRRRTSSSSASTRRCTLPTASSSRTSSPSSSSDALGRQRRPAAARQLRADAGTDCAPRQPAAVCPPSARSRLPCYKSVLGRGVDGGWAARGRAGSRVRALILDASGVNTIDSSAALSLRTILEQVRQVSVETAAPAAPVPAALQSRVVGAGAGAGSRGSRRGPWSRSATAAG